MIQKVKMPGEHVKLLQAKMTRLLNWPNPNGTIKDAYVPRWLVLECERAIKGMYVEQDEDMPEPKAKE